jgi:hypothetical protein
MRLCLPLPSLRTTSRRRSSKKSGLEPEEEAPFTYFTVEPRSQSPAYGLTDSCSSPQASDLSSASVSASRSLLSIPRTDRFRSVYAWLQSQECLTCPCSCCPDSPDSHYACTDVTRSAVSYCPDRGTYGSCIPDRGTFSPERRGVFTFPDSGRCRSAAAGSFYYSCPDTRRRLSAGSSGRLSSAGSTPPTDHSSRDFRWPEPPPVRHQHVRTGSLPSEANTEYIYLDFGGSQAKVPRAASGSWHVTRKEVQSPVRRSYA